MNFESPVSVFVVCKEIGSLPVIVKFDAVESIIGEFCRNLLEIKDFLLLRRQFFVLDLLELYDPIASLLSKRSISTSPFAMRLRSSSALSGVHS